MSQSSQIKTICEEFLYSGNSEEIILKQLTKIAQMLRTSDKYQKELFIQLSEKGLNKLLNGMKDVNSDIRKLSARVMIDLIYNNEILQNIFCEKFNFNPIGSVICINWVPKYFKETINIDEAVMIDIKNSFNGPKINRFWMYPENRDYNDDNFPDPQKYLIGFYYSSKNVRLLIFIMQNILNFEIKNIKKIDQNEIASKLEKCSDVNSD